MTERPGTHNRGDAKMAGVIEEGDTEKDSGDYSEGEMA